MRFFLAGRDRVTGSVRLVSESTFPSRQDALDSLGMLLPADGSFDGLDLFVADIEQSTPVVVYKPVVIEPLTNLPRDRPIADAWESPADAMPAAQAPLDASGAAGLSAVEEPYADAVIAELEAVVAEPEMRSEPEAPEPMPLMEALRRAADRMEADGIVAPEPVGATAVPESSAVVESPPAEDTESAASEEPVAEAPAATPASAQWPWEAAAEVSEPTTTEPEVEIAGDVEAEPASREPEVESAAGDAAATSSADLTAALEIGCGPLLSDEDLEAPAAYTPAGIEEPAPQVDSMLAAPDDEGFVPKPIIMGDYGAMPGDMAVESAFSAQPPTPEASTAETESPLVEEVAEPAIEPMGAVPVVEVEHAEPMGSLLGEVDQALRDAGSPESAGADSPEETATDLSAEASSPGASEPLDDLLATIAEPAAPAPEPKAYSPGGLDMNAYTCADCVYVGTCPKANEESPATCGSFQWKSM